MARIANFDDWIDLFKLWQDDIGLDERVGGDYRFEAKFGDLHSTEIEFGDFAGSPKWERVRQIPDQRVRDALLNLIVYQGDTEFASVEQQRHLVETAPSDYDFHALARVMCEEMRHGWQMSYLLCAFFGDAGRIEAQKLLERRAFEHKRLLGSFNERVNNWLDFFTYTQFIDRDGKFQLQMLSHSGFAPLARSMGPMLREESFHLGTGNDGLRRVVKAGVVPTSIIQKYFNKWIPTAYDLFGNDHSTSAHWSYSWGLKGRFDEHDAQAVADMEHLNEAARLLYREEIAGLTEALNRLLPAGSEPLKVPDIRFRRGIGEHAGKGFTIDGDPLSKEDYDQYLRRVLPSEDDYKALDEIARRDDWVERKNAPAPRAVRG
jgi:benzoyl-CoA 2,3-dioxygenase component B